MSALMHTTNKNYTGLSNTQSKPLLKIAIDAHLASHVIATRRCARTAALGA